MNQGSHSSEISSFNLWDLGFRKNTHTHTHTHFYSGPGSNALLLRCRSLGNFLLGPQNINTLLGPWP